MNKRKDFLNLLKFLLHMGVNRYITNHYKKKKKKVYL